MCFLGLWPVDARATFSVVAADRSAGLVGGAGASCLGSGLSVSVIYGAVPRAGVVHVQAELGGPLRMAAALDGLRAGRAPELIVSELTSPDFDPGFARRQYLFADLQGRRASFTGLETGAFAGDRTGRIDDTEFAVGGNLLAGPAVIDGLEAGVLLGCDLPERLIEALERAAAAGGDRRCAPAAADGAFLRVESATEVLLDLRVDNRVDAIEVLRADFDRWRANHPCPTTVAPPAGTPAAGEGCAAASLAPTGAWLLFAALVRRRRTTHTALRCRRV